MVSNFLEPSKYTLTELLAAATIASSFVAVLMLTLLVASILRLSELFRLVALTIPVTLTPDSLIVTAEPTIDDVAVTTPTTLTPDSLIVTAEPTIADVAVVIPTVMFGVPVRLCAVLAVPVTLPVRAPVILVNVAPVPVMLPANVVAETIPDTVRAVVGLVVPMPTLAVVLIPALVFDQ